MPGLVVRGAGSCAVFVILLLACFQVGRAQDRASKSGLDLKAIDQSVKPCDDFYQYACGTWMKTHPIPADESDWGRFNELHERIETTLRDLLQDSEAHEGRSQIDAQIGGLYHACMDEPEIERLGTAPLKPELDRIRAISNPSDLVEESARLNKNQVGVFFEFSSSPDLKDARMMIADLDQGGISLPERDYYLRTDAESKELLNKYAAHMQRMFQLAGWTADDARTASAETLAFETALAKASLDVTTRRNPELLLHEMSPAELDKISPDFDFQTYFAALGAPTFSKLNVDVPDFIEGINAAIQSSGLPAVRSYLAWRYVHASAKLLPKAMVDENFDFFGRTLLGQPVITPRWKRCVNTVDDELGEALGKRFVEKTFGEEGKQRTLALIHEIEHQMELDIDSVSWMTPETRQQALIKLHAVADKIGYPEHWRDYSSIRISPDDFFGDYYRANQFEDARLLKRIGHAVDRTEWGMTPPTVNAYYDPTQNNINFPAGILQPPFFSSKTGDGVNYGAIGMIVGHELTHGFDDQGRKFDQDGNLKDWWQPADAKQYSKLSSCFVDEYSSFKVLPGLNVNGKLTLGENTADNGGLRLAYKALLADLATKAIPVDTRTDGFTEPQQFFLGFAQAWCENMRPETERVLTQTDPHSLPQFRVTGVLRNSPEFSQAFGCKPGDKMYAASACRVW